MTQITKIRHARGHEIVVNTVLIEKVQTGFRDSSEIEPHRCDDAARQPLGALLYLELPSDMTAQNFSN